MGENDSHRLPSFASLDELVEFFDTKDMGDYEEDLPEAHFEVNLKTKTHPSIQIKVTSSDRNPIVSVLHGLDFNDVHVIYQEYAVKALVPLTILITAPTVFFLNKFVLEPLVGPIAERWKKAVTNYFSPIKPFNLTVEITDEHLVLDASIEKSHHITSDMWSVLRRAIDVLKLESRLAGSCRARFTETKSGELLVITYELDKPPRMLDIEKRQTMELPEDLISEASTACLSPEAWFKKQLEKADAYGEYIADSQEEKR